MADNNQTGEQYFNFGKPLESGKVIGTGAPVPWAGFTPETYPETMRYAGKSVVYIQPSSVTFYKIQGDLSFKETIAISTAADIPEVGDDGDVQTALDFIRGEVTQLFAEIDGLVASDIGYLSGDITNAQEALDDIYNRVEIKHLRLSPTSDSSTLTLVGVLASIISITINKLTYYGKEDDGLFGDADFVYRYSGGNTEIQINEGILEFVFDASMVVDVLYKNLTS